MSRITDLHPDQQKLYWTVPKLWPNSTVFIIGGGPSINDMDLNQLRELNTIICNTGFMAFPWAKVMYFGDCKVHTWISWEDGGRYAEGFDNYTGLKVSCCPDTLRDSRIHTLYRRRRGLTDEPRTVGWNCNTGASAVNLAMHLGAKKVVLIGFDLQQINGKSNFHNYNFIPDEDPISIYKKFMNFWPYVKESAEKFGLEIVNTTLNSKLDLFPFVKLEDVLSGLS